MKTVFSVYRPVLDYEESERHFFICATREIAETKIKEITTELNQLLRDLGPQPDFDKDYIKWCEFEAKKYEIFEMKEFGFLSSCDSYEDYDGISTFNLRALDIQEMKFYE